MHHHGHHQIQPHHKHHHHHHHRPRTNIDVIVGTSPFMYGFWNQPYYFYSYEFNLLNLIVFLIIFIIIVGISLGIYYGYYKKEKFTNENNE